MFFTLISFFVAIGILVTFHELGHYCAARLCGVRILRFSIGFGKVLAKYTDNHQTEWVLSLIPLGGYIKMQEGSSDSKEDDPCSSFTSQSVYRRFFIVSAGPISNFIFAVMLCTILNLSGIQEPAAILADPPISTIAYKSGFQKGDVIQSINEKSIFSWKDADQELSKLLFSKKIIKVSVKDCYGFSRNINIDTDLYNINPSENNIAQKNGFLLSAGKSFIHSVKPNDIADIAGLRKGDLITSISSVHYPDPASFTKIIQDNIGLPIEIGIDRRGETIHVVLIPINQIINQVEVGHIGVEIETRFPMITTRYSFLQSINHALTYTSNTAFSYLKMIGKMVTGKVSVNNIGGPLTIASHAGQTARFGLSNYISYLAFISISLGVLNLLPIPMLDGGYLFYYLIEILRGYPVSDKFMMITQRLGLFILIIITSLALFNDFSRILFY
ncbi:MAG: RIP metalloprotease RseP [Bordetella sp.]|nr:MAG: RIP metalloprotease RseP [Bordetella sp.]